MGWEWANGEAEEEGVEEVEEAEGLATVAVTENGARLKVGEEERAGEEAAAAAEEEEEDVAPGDRASAPAEDEEGARTTSAGFSLTAPSSSAAISTAFAGEKG